MTQIVNMCSNEGLDLIQLMQYRITDECLSIFYASGDMVKVQKSKLLSIFSYEPLNVNNSISLLDMGFIWRIVTPSNEDREKHDATAFTWRDYSKKLFNLILNRHQSSKLIILVNDHCH